MVGRSAPTATTGITRMTALPTASMGQSGSPVASSSVLGRGLAMAGATATADAVLADEALEVADLAAGASLADAVSIAADADSSATVVSPHTEA